MAVGADYTAGVQEPLSMKAILLTLSLVSLLLGVLVLARVGLGGPSDGAIEAAVLERLSDTIELSDLEIERTPAFVFRGDQLITYSAQAVIKQDYVRRLNPFDWYARCEPALTVETNSMPADKALRGTKVYEIAAKQGANLTLIGRMKAYRKDDRWAFTARKRRLMDGDTRIRRTPVSTVRDAVMVNSREFERLCEALRPAFPV